MTLLKQPRQLRQQPRRLPSAESTRESGANRPPNSVTPLLPPLGDQKTTESSQGDKSESSQGDN